MSATFTPAQAAFRFALDGIETQALAIANDALRFAPLPGASGAGYVSTPDHANNSLTGSQSYVALVQLNNWASGAVQNVIGKRSNTTSQLSFTLDIGTTGIPEMTWSPDGTGGSSQTRSCGTAITTVASKGQRVWLLVIAESSVSVRWYTAPYVAGSYAIPAFAAFTLLGSAWTLGGAFTVFDGTAPITLGAVDAGVNSVATGGVTRAAGYSGVYGSGSETLKWDFNPNLDAANGATSVTSNVTSEVWTLNGNAWLAAQSTNVTLNVFDELRVLLRVRVQESGGAAGLATDDYPLQLSRNGGGYSTITTSSTYVRAVDSPTLTDQNATTNKLGAGTGSFVAGVISEDGTADNKQITASNYMEFLYAITLRAADLAAADTLDFRLLRNAATMTYTVTPRITIGTVATTPSASAGGASSQQMSTMSEFGGFGRSTSL